MFKHPSARHLFLFLAVLFGMAFILLSVLPVNRIALGTRPPFGANAAQILHAQRLHALVHVALFGSLAAVAWCAAKSHNGKLIAFVLVLLLGYGTEYMQHLVYRNALELNDISINFITGVAAFSIFALIDRFRKVVV
jgi:hypothetical protein